VTAAGASLLASEPEVQAGAPVASAGVSDFFRAVFGDAVSPERRLVVWSKEQGSVWCSSIDEAAEATLAATPRFNTYFGCGLQDPELAMRIAAQRARDAPKSAPRTLEQIRGTADSVVAIGGAWADLDVGTEGHKRKDNPPTLDAALETIRKTIPHAPSAIVSTGGGVHSWWLFREVWVLENDAERIRAQRLVQGVQETVRLALHAAGGWSLDSTHDLARVLRAPGTLNHKPDYGSPRPVRLL
jgi:hypothetical protein